MIGVMFVKKFFVAVMLSVFFVAQTALAMTFQPPVKIGEIGFPAQAPYHGFIINGATSNDGTPYREEVGDVTTYKIGTARFGELFCKYDFDADYLDVMDFGGANDLVLSHNASFKDIFRIDGDGLTLYALYHNYCTTDLKILGQRGGKWFVFVDSKKLSEKYFDGNDGYKLDGSVIYDVPTCAGDTIVVTWRRWHWDADSQPEGEFRFTWDDAAQNFNVKQIVY